MGILGGNGGGTVFPVVQVKCQQDTVNLLSDLLQKKPPPFSQVEIPQNP